jgi:hypothetical protein
MLSVPCSCNFIKRSLPLPCLFMYYFTKSLCICIALYFIRRSRSFATYSTHIAKSLVIFAPCVNCIKRSPLFPPFGCSFVVSGCCQGDSSRGVWLLSASSLSATIVSGDSVLLISIAFIVAHTAITLQPSEY